MLNINDVRKIQGIDVDMELEETIKLIDSLILEKATKGGREIKTMKFNSPMGLDLLKHYKKQGFETTLYTAPWCELIIKW